MSLILRIQSYRKLPPAAPVERRFDRLGGTIGRAAGNDLELPDPGKYISRTHCKLDFVEGRYTLIDLGSNPSWLNDRPLGTGKTATLGDGDTLIIGDYVLQVAVDEAPAAHPVPVFEPDYSPGHPFQAQPAAGRQVAPEYINPKDTLSGANILDTGAGMAAPAGAGDPLGLNLFGQAGAVPDPLAFRGSEFDHAPAQHAPMDAIAVASPFEAPAAPAAPPAAAPHALIPDDYDPLADFLPPRVQPSAQAAAAPAPR
ncbi:FHA domain-containing protein, partial [Devosia sp.]|uniref:type VI secretion system-associated FHA domain protein n=1 Tax=Devosia sp. TaxID=1871048 RepID=UPI002628B30B